MNFPKIEKIEDCLKAIEGFKEFTVSKKDGYTVINYAYQDKETFKPHPVSHTLSNIRKECRGITFDNNGKIIARKYHKFFNVGENETALFRNIDLNKAHLILEKLDGSMITPVFINNQIQWHTKNGETEISQFVYEFIKENQNYNDFAREMISKNATPIFEYCSRKNQVVLDYKTDRLVLTAIRDNITGEYMPYRIMKEFCNAYELEIVNTYNSKESNIENLVNEIYKQNGIEGFVIRFDDGKMFKIKTDEYIKLHGATAKYTKKKNVLELIATNSVDDILPRVPENLAIRINTFNEKVLKRIMHISDKIKNEIMLFLKTHAKTERKSFALDFLKDKDKMLSGVYFNVLDGKNSTECIKEFILKNCNSAKGMEKIEEILGEIEF